MPVDAIKPRPAPPKLHALPKFTPTGSISPSGDVFIPMLILPTDPSFTLLAFDPSVGATGYRLFWGTNSMVYTDNKNIGNFLSGSVNPLLPGTTYYFAATAYNDDCLESGFSDEVSTTTRYLGSTGDPSTNPATLYNVGFSQEIAPDTCNPVFTFGFTFDASPNTVYQVQNKANSLSDTNAWNVLETYYVHPSINPTNTAPFPIDCRYTFDASTNPPAQYFRVVNSP